MSTVFPTALDALANPSPGDPRTAPSHAGQHTDANDAIEALQAKVGVDGSVVTTSLDYKTSGLGGFTPGRVFYVSADGRLTTSANLTWDDAQGCLLIGATAALDPSARLEIARDGELPLSLRAYTSAAPGSSAQWKGLRARGTQSAPSDISAGDSLLRWYSEGYRGGFRPAAEMRMVAEAVGATTVDGAVQWLVHTGGSEFTRMTLTNSGQLRPTAIQETVVTVAAAGAAETVDVSAGNVYDVTLDANCTVTLSGATSGKACSLTLYLRQSGAGSFTVTWPASVNWAGGVAPTLSTTAGDYDIVTLITLDGGTNWDGGVFGQDFS